jgi:glycosyltransferase involved in cell wall biosynthesis
MKITIVQGAFLPVPPVAGGAVEKIWFDLGKEFARRGLDVTHISRRYPDLADRTFDEAVRHVRVEGFDYPRSGLLAKAQDLIYSLRALRRIERSDVVVTNTFFLPLLLSLLALVSNSARRGVIYVSVHRYPQKQMFLYRGADRLQCVSTAVADAVREQTPDVGPLVKVIPNYVASVLSDEQGDAAWPLREKIVLFVGRLHPEKGVHLLIGAFAQIAAELREGWKLRIVGPHDIRRGGAGDEYLDMLKALAASHALEIDWVGSVYDREVLDGHYRKASVFVYPSTAAKGEASPLAPLEAMSQGCPAVTSELTCFADYVVPDVNASTFQLRDGMTASLLADCLTRLVTNPRQRREFSRAGLATARGLTLTRIADSLYEDFASLCTTRVNPSLRSHPDARRP